MKAKDVREKLGGIADRVIAKKDGSYEARHGYFYHHGRSAETLTRDVRAALGEIEVLDAGDRWAPWPRDSFLWVQFRVKEAV